MTISLRPSVFTLMKKLPDCVNVHRNAGTWYISDGRIWHYDKFLHAALSGWHKKHELAAAKAATKEDAAIYKSIADNYKASVATKEISND